MAGSSADKNAQSVICQLKLTLRTKKWNTLPEANSKSTWKMDGWKTKYTSFLGPRRPIFRGKMALSFGEKISRILMTWSQKLHRLRLRKFLLTPLATLGLERGGPNLVPWHGGYGIPSCGATSCGFTLMPQKGIQKNMKEIDLCQMAVSKRHHEGVKVGWQLELLWASQPAARWRFFLWFALIALLALVSRGLTQRHEGRWPVDTTQCKSYPRNGFRNKSSIESRQSHWDQNLDFIEVQIQTQYQFQDLCAPSIASQPASSDTSNSLVTCNKQAASKCLESKV